MAEQLCGNYTTITDRQGRNALKGAIAYEGFAECEFVMSYTLISHPDPCLYPKLQSLPCPEQFVLGQQCDAARPYRSLLSKDQLDIPCDNSAPRSDGLCSPQ